MKKRMMILSGMILLWLLSVSGSSAVSCSDRKPVIEHHSMYSEALHGRLRFDVYVPPCMDKRISGGYPVLYLLHGQDMGISIWQKMNTAALMQETINREDLPLFLIVAPQEDQYLLSFSLSGYREAIVNELIPRIDSLYNTCTARECRGISGLSRGALWAELIAFEEPELFGSLAMLSMPGTILDDQRLYYLTERQKPDLMLRIRMDSGSEDHYRHEGNKAADQLTFIGYPYEYYIQPGDHNTEYWQARLPEYFVWFSEGWKEKALD